MKTCINCEEQKEDGEFHKKKSSKDGLQSACKKCKHEQAVKWNKNNPIKKRTAQLKRRYGISTEDFDKMLKDQDNECAICCEKEPGGHGKFHVDHCHETGIIRGLLCHHCNVGLGMFKECEWTMWQAIGYINKEE